MVNAQRYSVWASMSDFSVMASIAHIVHSIVEVCLNAWIVDIPKSAFLMKFHGY